MCHMQSYKAKSYTYTISPPKNWVLSSLIKIICQLGNFCRLVFVYSGFVMIL